MAITLQPIPYVFGDFSCSQSAISITIRNFARMKVIHVDMDQFFAAVEQRENPELRGKPIAVGHDAERGVVSTASYEARRFGVHSAQSIQVAKRLCPQLIIVEDRKSVV